MKKNKGTGKLKYFALMLLVLFIAVTAKVGLDTFKTLRANETFTEVDYFSVQKYSDKNCKAVMNALKSGKAEKLSKLMLSGKGASDVMAFADWSKADFKNAEGMGAGSLSAKPDTNGVMDINERFIVDVDGEKYILFIETQTSRWGRTEDGISCVAAMTYKHFDSLDWAWNGESDEESACAGKAIWQNSK